MNIYNAIISSGRLPENPHGSIKWLPNAKLNFAIIHNEQITSKRKRKEKKYRSNKNNNNKNNNNCKGIMLSTILYKKV